MVQKYELFPKLPNNSAKKRQRTDYFKFAEKTDCVTIAFKTKIKSPKFTKLMTSDINQGYKPNIPWFTKLLSDIKTTYIRHRNDILMTYSLHKTDEMAILQYQRLVLAAKFSREFEGLKAS